MEIKKWPKQECCEEIPPHITFECSPAFMSQPVKRIFLNNTTMEVTDDYGNHIGFAKHGVHGLEITEQYSG
jgi:hypothetical protein